MTSYEYDNRGRMVETTQPDPDGGGALTSPVASYVYDDAGQLTSMTDPLGRTTSYAYDNLGRQITVTLPDPDGGGAQTSPVSSTTYDAVGNVLTQTDALGNVTTYEYDNLYRLIETTYADPDGGGAQTSPVVSSTYDAAGQLLTSTDALGNVTTYEYDNLGRQVKVTLPDPDGVGGQSAPVTTLVYDVGGNQLSMTDSLGNTTYYGYDNLYRRIVETDANGDDTLFGYDAAGQLLTVTDAVSNVTEFEYDNLGRLIVETITVDSTALEREFAYDAMGNLTQRVDRKGKVMVYAYDNLYRRTTETWYDEVADIGYSSTNVISMEYNAVGSLTAIDDDYSDYAYTYDNLDRILTITSDNSGAPTVVLTAEYDANGRRTELAAAIDSDDDFLNSYLYDNLNRLTRVTQEEQSGGNEVTEKRVDLTYNANGQFASISRYEDLAGTDLVADTAYTYDDQNRLTDLDHTKGMTTIVGYSWTFDSAGRITQYDNSVDGVVDYTYDDRGQLTGADYDYQTDESYTYDENGNRTNGSYSTGDHNLLETDGTYNYFYDDEGNRIKRTEISSGDYIDYEWDNRNRLTNVKHYNSSNVLQKEVVYEYDAFDRRIAKKVDDNGNTTIDRAYRYVYDEAGKMDSNGHGHLDDIVLVFDDSNNLTTRYLHGPGIDQPFAEEQLYDVMGTPTVDELVWLLSDHQGTVRDTVTYDAGMDATSVLNHITYDAFGNITGETNSSETPLFAYTGREWDEDAQLYYYRARWYDSVVGQFVSDDPIGFYSGDANIQRYVGNGPVTATDPSGLAEELVLPDNPDDLPSEWQRDPTHRDPNGSRFRHPDGRYLDWHRGRPDLPGWRGRDHWHLNGGHDHLPPGTVIRVIFKPWYVRFGRWCGEKIVDVGEFVYDNRKTIGGVAIITAGGAIVVFDIVTFPSGEGAVGVIMIERGSQFLK